MRSIGYSFRLLRRCYVQRKWCTDSLSTTMVGTNQLRLYSTEPLPEPHVEATDKVYQENIQQIVNDIGKLTLIEVADLNELLKKTLRIADAPVMAMGAAPIAQAAAPQEEEEDTGPKKPLAFTVVLAKFDAKKKVALIKELKGIMEGMNLVQAKKFVESAPVDVKTDIPKDEAEKLKEAIEKAGGTAEVKET